MIRKLASKLLMAVGIVTLAIFVWKGWGESGNIAGFFLMLWDGFYGLCSGLATAVRTAIG